jgi:tRNA-dihydrouridine synthase
MAGVTDTAFRQLCKNFGADVIYTEFASADALVYENAKTRDLIAYDPMEQPVVCQIFGKKPEHYFKAVKILEEMGFAGVDINFGCPAYKVVKSGGGVTLMRNLPLCRELVQAACEGTKLPVSIKIRASIRRGQDTKDKIENQEAEDELDQYECPVDVVTALDLVKKIKDLPIGAIMIHGRSFEQPFDGEPNLNIITEVRKTWSGVLIANGGIYTPEKAKEVLATTGADGVGLARGAWGKPWLFQQVKDYLNTGSYHELPWDEIKQVMLQHAELALAHKGQHGLIELRKHLSWYVKGFSGASSIRSQLVRVHTLDDVKEILSNAS